MKKITSEDTLGIFFIAQFGIGFIGNTLLFLLHIKTLIFQPHKKKPIVLIRTHLILANVMTILFSGIPEIVHFFGLRNFLDDIGCKAVLYMYRVSRGLSLCTMSFLSMFQAVIIIPSNSRWAWLKSKVSSYIFPVFSFFWLINMLIYVRVIQRVKASYNISGAEQAYSLNYCMARDPDKLKSAAFLGGMVARDFLCLFIMIWTSGHMVIMLFTHRKTVQYVHRASLYPVSSPETKATHTILALVICFFFFHWTNSCFTIYVSYRHNVQGLENINIFLSSCYPAICPFLMIQNSNRGSFLNSVFAKMRKSFPKTISLGGFLHTSVARGMWLEFLTT